MNAIDLCVFLTSFSLAVCVFAIGDLLRSRRRRSIMGAMVSLIALILTTVVGFRAQPDRNYLELLLFLAGERDFSAIFSAGLGLSAALLWATRWIEPFRRTEGYDHESRRTMSVQLLMATSVIGVTVCGTAFVWKEIHGSKRDPAARVHADEFVIQKVARIDHPPIRLAALDSNHAFVCYDYFEEAGTIGGGIVRLSRPDAAQPFEKRIVADSPLLMRCYGLALRDGDLYVSRSGLVGQASAGKVRYENTGAVTQLRDLDRDGYYEFMDDIVSGLPGARGPDTMQQNNGICFDSQGNLFITTACAADRTLTDHPWDGTILQVPAAQLAATNSAPEVFARGFRNPFGITFGPDQQLFVTDNDVNENPGDELNHVTKGSHYGHPFVVPGEKNVPAAGFREPVLTGEHEWNFLGIAYADSTALPDRYRNCLYVADFMQHAIWKIKLVRSGNTFSVQSLEKFASVSSPIDIAVTPSGDFFVLSRNTQNLYRIHLRESIQHEQN